MSDNEQEQVEDEVEVVEDADAETAENENESGKYISQYIKFTTIKPLFSVKEGDKDVQVRISGNARELVKKYLDDKIVEGVNEILSKLPRKTKGEQKGNLKRFTIRDTDLNT